MSSVAPTAATTPPEALLPPASSRLAKLPTYAFARLDELKAAARARGMDVIDFGMGNPDMPTPAPVVEAIQAAVAAPVNHGYPTFQGMPAFRQAVARWMQRRYEVSFDPETEVQALIGSKEGLAHLTFAYVAEGDTTLVPSPYYPVHGRATWLAGGDPYFLPLRPENNFLPALSSIPEDVAQRAKLLFLNFPNNPTAATADLAFYESAIAFCKRHQIVCVSDLAYAEIAFDGYRPPSIFEVPGARDVAIEFHSFSKSFNMAGWRLGFAVGNAQIVKNLYSLKTNLDYGVSQAIQAGGVVALEQTDDLLPGIVSTYQKRRDVMVAGFRGLGWPVEPTKATMYLWLPVPPGYTSAAWCEMVLNETGVVFTPGSGFGDAGEGYFRLSLIAPEPTLAAALARLNDKGIRFQ
jgi:LL-diaminopimelate aminotransferase